MNIRFIGSGSGFADEHTSAYFSTEDNELVIIDCPVSTFQKLKKSEYIDLRSYEKIYILITHTHGDHIGGLGLFAQYTYFTLKVPVVIVAPSKDVAHDIATVLKIEGNESSWFSVITSDTLKDKPWLLHTILTKHSPQLEGKCFGYNLSINGKNIVYTGDTSTLEPFYPYLTPGAILYVDTSVYYGMIHLKLEDAISDFLSLLEKGVQTIYLMHLDDVNMAKKMVANVDNINVVDIFE